MFSFLVGLATGIAVLVSGPQVRRGLARAVLKGKDLAEGVAKETRRATARMAEDFEDAIAEVKAERDRAQVNAEREAEVLRELSEQLRRIRADVASLDTKTERIQ